MKNYFYIIVWIIYFSFYLSQKDNYLLQYISWNIELFSYVNAFFWVITTIWIIWVFDIKIDKILLKNKESHFVSTIDKMMFIFKYIFSFYVAFYLAILPLDFRSFISKVFFILVVFLLLFILTDFINVFFKTELKKSKLVHISKHLFPFLSKLIIVFIWIIWIITVVSNLGYNVSALIAWAWIWWIAVALAAQKSLTNIFWAITILLNKPFKIWDMIILSWTTWIVRDIWLTYLTLTDRLWHQVMIPNEAILTWKIENLSIRENRRTEFKIWVIYWTTLDKVREWVKIIEDILQKYVEQKTVSEYRVNFDMFWSFSLDINITYFSLINNDLMSYLKQKEEINLEIKKEFAEAKIEVAFPTQELIIKK